MRTNHLGFSNIEGLLIVVIVGIIGFSGWYVYSADKNANQAYNSVSNSQPMHSSPKKPTAGGVTYENGKLVPADSQARAKEAGYYCPSWDAKPGAASADFCVTLDK